MLYAVTNVRGQSIVMASGRLHFTNRKWKAHCKCLLPVRHNRTAVSLIVPADLTTPKDKFGSSVSSLLLNIFLFVISLRVPGKLAYSQHYIY